MDLLGRRLATKGSTTWNFVLNDRLVYAGVGPHRLWPQRFVKSWLTNTVSLVLRVPLLLLLAHNGTPHTANVVTLVVLFGLRFWVSDRFVWDSKRWWPTSRASRSSGQPLPMCWSR